MLGVSQWKMGKDIGMSKRYFVLNLLLISIAYGAYLMHHATCPYHRKVVTIQAVERAWREKVSE